MDSESSLRTVSRSALLQAPFEVRHKILKYALLAQAYDFTHPFGEYGIPFDRPLLTVFSKAGMESQVRGGWEWESFWFTEKMTCLMRVNKQLYHEVYSTLYTEFAIHFACPFAVKPDEWMDWLRERNPRAIQTIAHLHIKAYIILIDEDTSGCKRKKVDENEDNIIKEYRALAQGFPRLRTVRFQLEFTRDKPQTPSSVEECVNRILRRAAAFEGLQVMIFAESLSGESTTCEEGLHDIMAASRKSLNQSQECQTWQY